MLGESKIKVLLFQEVFLSFCKKKKINGCADTKEIVQLKAQEIIARKITVKIIFNVSFVYFFLSETEIKCTLEKNISGHYLCYTIGLIFCSIKY